MCGPLLRGELRRRLAWAWSRTRAWCHTKGMDLTDLTWRTAMSGKTKKTKLLISGFRWFNSSLNPSNDLRLMWGSNKKVYIISSRFQITKPFEYWINLDYGPLWFSLKMNLTWMDECCSIKLGRIKGTGIIINTVPNQLRKLRGDGEPESNAAF